MSVLIWGILQDVLESTFGHMKDKVQRTAKNDRASPYTLWMYATTSTYPSEGGLNQADPVKKVFEIFFDCPEDLATTSYHIPRPYLRCKKKTIFCSPLTLKIFHPKQYLC